MWLFGGKKIEKNEKICNCGCKKNIQPDDEKTHNVHWELNSDVSVENSEVTDIYHYIFGNLLIETTVFDNVKFELYHTKMSHLINEIPKWRSEPEDKEYIAILKNNLKYMEFPHLMGTIKVLRSQNDDNAIKLIDGWHRCRAIYELYLESEKRWDIDLLIEVYYLTDLETCDFEMNSIYAGANQKSSINSNIMPEYKISQVIERMKEEWPNCISEKDLVKMPKVSKKRLYNAIKQYVLNSQLDEKEIYIAIVDINKQISETKLADLFNTTHPTITQMKIYQSAKELNFYLNLQCTIDMETWISELESR